MNLFNSLNMSFFSFTFVLFHYDWSFECLDGLILFSTASWPSFSAWGGYLPPLGCSIFWSKNQGFRSKKVTTPEYRQFLTSIKNIGVNSPKIEPTRSKSKFPRKRRKSRFCQNRSFSGILTSATKTALTRSFLAQFTSFLLHMRTDSLF